MTMQLTGQSFVAGRRTNGSGQRFRATNPAKDATLDPGYSSATPEEVDEAVRLAAEAFDTYAHATGKAKAAFLRRAADGLDAHKEELAERAQLETALPMPRLLGEAGRTSGQLRLFAGVVEEGSWVDARIDPAIPDREPAPRADIRSMLRPLGPVAIFGASNFPLAFSVAGGDTASALAAGCPVIVKAHPAHPGTSEIAAQILTEAAADEGLPRGVFSLLFDAGIDVGSALVRHPLMRAVAFTGSLRAGRALMDFAAARPDPIPCFAEMSSGNPVFVLPGALRKDPAEFAKGLFGSFTLGAGQMCTKPGIVLLPESPETAKVLAELGKLVEEAKPYTLLTSGIARSYAQGTKTQSARTQVAAQATMADHGNACAASAQIFTASLEELLATPSLAEEIFGPDTLLIRCDSAGDHLRAARALDGHLTAAIFGDEEDLAENRELIRILEQKAGRLIFNGFPTGVEVNHSMVHGGPYPSTSDPRFTSVGSLAIYRFAKPVCFQGFPEAHLPPELRDANPLGIRRLRDGKPEAL
jgi:2,5-dioxopentanoate dehydrogenase